MKEPRQELNEGRAFPDARTPDAAGTRASYALVLIFLFLAAGILTAGYLYFRYHEKQYSMRVEQELSAIKELKVSQIVNWREERINDVRIISESQAIISGISRFIENERDYKLRDETLKFMSDLVKYYSYERAMLFNTDGRLMLLAGEKPDHIESHVKGYIAEAMQKKKVDFIDLHKGETAGEIHFGISVPLFLEVNKESRFAGVLILRIDPFKFLYPLILSWPTPSRTGETLLVRREGDEVLFINELRHRKNTEFSLRFSLSKKNLPAAMAVLGTTSIVEGIDYRGLPVMASIGAIPDSPWFIVSKMDKDEIYTPMRERLWVVVILVGLLLLGAGLGIGLVWRQQRVMHYRLMYKTAEALRESEQKYRILVETMNEGLGVQDKNGIITYMNTRACEMFGYKLEDLIGKPVDVLFDEEGLKTFKAQMAQRRQGTEESYEVVWRRKDGVRVPTLVAPHVIYDAEGNYDGSFGVFIDITERKKAEEKLHESEALIRAVMDNLPIGIAVNSVDPNVKFDYMNDNFIRYYRTTREALAEPDAFWEAVYEDPEFREEIKKRVLSDCASGEPARMYWADVPITRKGDETAFITARNIPIPDRQLMISTVWDVTERRKSQEALQKSEAFIKNILESVGEGFVVVDPEYKIISANRAYCEMQKTRLEEIIGKHCHEVSHHSDKPCFMEGEECAPKHTFKTGEPYFTIHTHYDKEDNPIYIETRSYPMKNAEGKVFAVIEILNNITEKRMLEGQLRHAQKMEAIGILAGGIAHDFNNILNVIIGYASLMQMHMSHDDPKTEQVKEILNAGDRAANLTKGLLTFSRKQVMEIRRINLNEIIEGFNKMIARIIGEDIELRIIPSEQALTVKADIVQIEQVLLNLASNAKDAMPKGGILTIETIPVSIDSAFIKTHGYGEPGMHALITVSDTGAGMNDKTRERIFEPFFTTKELGRGTGLGLSIVYGIVKQHNGYINCYSEPGKGTTFKIYLPLIKEEAEKIEMAEAELPGGGTETILIAEDDASVRGLIKEILEGVGYKVIEAIDGEDAVVKFRENKDDINLLLFDLIMPKKNGKDAYEDIKGIRHDIKVIFTSGYAADIMQTFGVEKGIEFISKPVFPNDLLRKVRDMLG